MMGYCEKSNGVGVYHVAWIFTFYQVSLVLNKTLLNTVARKKIIFTYTKIVQPIRSIPRIPNIAADITNVASYS